MKVSKKDRWLLAAFLGILVFACSYLFVFQPAMEKADALEVENMQLQGRIMDLKNKEANQETYESEILRMEQEIEDAVLTAAVTEAGYEVKEIAVK